jgi:hypothetical protein
MEGSALEGEAFKLEGDVEGVVDLRDLFPWLQHCLSLLYQLLSEKYVFSCL